MAPAPCAACMFFVLHMHGGVAAVSYVLLVGNVRLVKDALDRGLSGDLAVFRRSVGEFLMVYSMIS